VSGRVKHAVEKYRQGCTSPIKSVAPETDTAGAPRKGGKELDALRGTLKQFFGMLPVLAGVVLRVGLFQAFLPRAFLMTLFSGNPVLDTVWGACAGSIFTGNPIVSYAVGETLVKMNVSLFAAAALVTAAIVSLTQRYG